MASVVSSYAIPITFPPLGLFVMISVELASSYSMLTEEPSTMEFFTTSKSEVKGDSYLLNFWFKYV